MRKNQTSKQMILCAVMMLTVFFSILPMSALAASQNTVVGINGGTVSYGTGMAISVTDETSGESAGKIIIKEAGTYTFSGNLTAEKIEINLEKNPSGTVVLLLQNARIGNEKLATAVQAKSQGKVSIILGANSTNSITAAEQAMEVSGDITVSGSGTLLTKGNFSTESSLTMNAGNLLLKKGDMRTKGNITLNGGRLVANGSLSAGRFLLLNNGVLLSAGGDTSTVSSVSKQKSIQLSLTDPISGNLVVADENGETVFAGILPEEISESLLLSAPGLVNEENVQIFHSCDIEETADTLGIIEQVSSFSGKALLYGNKKSAIFPLPETVNIFSDVMEEKALLNVEAYTKEDVFGYTLEKTELKAEKVDGVTITSVEIIGDDFEVTLNKSGQIFVSPKAGFHAGEYSGKLSVQYCIENRTENLEVPLSFTVKQAVNSWTQELSMASYMEYEGQAHPAGKAAFGSLIYTYSTDRAGTFSEKAPSSPGTYYVKAVVLETKDYTGLDAVKEFQIYAHTHDYKETGKSGTCTTGIRHTYTCAICKNSYTETSSGKEHTFDAGNVTKEPDCVHSGVKTYTCVECGYSYTEPISALGHDYDNGKVTKEATCGQAGIKTYTCSRNTSHTYTETIPAGGSHRYEGKVTREATCQAEGVRTYTCRICGDSYTESIPVTGHDYDKGKVTKEASCKSKGTTTYTCKNCGDTYTKDIPPLGKHEYGEGVVTTSATCEKDGVRTYTCSVCGVSYTKAIPAAGHKYDNGIVTKKATCEANGIKTFTCTSCGKSYSEKLPALGHKWNDGEVTKEPTCTEEGEKTYTCQNDKEHVIKDTIQKLDHEWDEGKVTKEPDCGHEGIKTYTCKVGKETKEEAIPATGEHTWGEGMEAVDGKIVYLCSTCGETRYEDADSVLTDDDSSEADDATAVTSEAKTDNRPTKSSRIKTFVIILYAMIFVIAGGIIFAVLQRKKKGF